MQDYSVSFSTAIDVVFMGETQGFSKMQRPLLSLLHIRDKGRGRREGGEDSPPAVLDV